MKCTRFLFIFKIFDFFDIINSVSTLYLKKGDFDRLSRWLIDYNFFLRQKLMIFFFFFFKLASTENFRDRPIYFTIIFLVRVLVHISLSYFLKFYCNFFIKIIFTTINTVIIQFNCNIIIMDNNLHTFL